jgi:DtxR family transcriptional regulator, Mn-dependent transcriptional regulator
MQSTAVQDYLKAIYELEHRDDGRASTTQLAERLGVTPASATTMMKKLASLGLLEHEPYHGVVLTDAGRSAALEVIRHHRLIERFLVDILAVPWDEVHDEAERWEHVLSEEMEERIDAALGFPRSDPHGSPIPAGDGTIPSGERTPMSELEPGSRGVVAEVSDEHAPLLRYLGDVGLYPGTEFEVVEAAPFGGPLTVRVGGVEHALGLDAVREVLVAEVRP